MWVCDLVFRRLWRSVVLIRRVWVSTLVTFVMLASLLYGMAASAPRTVTVPTQLAGSGAPVRQEPPPAPCAGEGEKCFNSCTMGEDATYPEGDPRRAVPGPCDMRAVLPYDGTFQVVVTRLLRSDPCDPDGTTRWYAGHVEVSVVAPGNQVLASSGVDACLPPGDPLDGDVSGVLPSLYREAASAL